jgi:hypothetical protein
MEETQDIIGALDENFRDENFETQKYLYSNMREFLVILLRILSAKFNHFTSLQ